MTQLTSKKLAAIACCFIGGAVFLSCFAGTPARQDSSGELSHIVPLGTFYSPEGDRITVEEVHGNAEKLAPGNTYEVEGRYKLVSKDQAMLAVWVTTDGSQPHASHPPLPAQKMIVNKGEGHFTLRFHMWEWGNPHVSFYSAKGGNSFVSAYF